MPPAAWPGSVQRYSYVPALAMVTVRVADLPGESTAVAFPEHAFAVPPLVHSLKSWLMAPLLVTLKVTLPCGTLFAESWNPNSEGFPAVTVTVVPAARD